MSKPIKLEINKEFTFHGPGFNILTKKDRILLERVFNYCMQTAHDNEYIQLVLLKNKLLSK